MKSLAQKTSEMPGVDRVMMPEFRHEPYLGAYMVKGEWREVSAGAESDEDRILECVRRDVEASLSLS